jgi:hypothetical protein
MEVPCSTTIFSSFVHNSLITLFLFSLQASITGAKVKGLKGCKTLNKDPDPKNPIEGTEMRYILLHITFLFYSQVIRAN